MRHCCWWCTLDIKGDELQLPFKQDKGGKIHTMGKFCSWECIKSYNIKENKLKFGNIQGLITLMRQKMYGKITPLNCAPNMRLLKKFGGPLTEKEYRESIGNNPPLLRMPETVNFLHHDIRNETYVPKKNAHETDAQKITKIFKSQTVSETLKLKRPIPIKHTENNLESALGIIRHSKNV